MSFFSEEQKSTGNDFELGGGNDPIPHNTRCNAMIDEVKWDDYQGERYISLRWTVLEPSDYKNRKVFQKLKVLDGQKGDKAKRMLAAIDANAGGSIVALGREPTDQDLMSLLNRPMLIQVMVWEMTGDDGQKRTGNWINKVSASGIVENPAPVQATNDDDEIPFQGAA